jgi:hypothetical protein
MSKVAEAVIKGNNVQKMKVSSHPLGNVCVWGVCVCFECLISVVLGICITSITNVCSRDLPVGWKGMIFWYQGLCALVG